MLHVWLITLLLLTFTACSQVVTPTPAVISQQPTFPAVVTFTPSPIPSPTATPTPSTTPDRVATALATPLNTPRPTFTPAPTFAPEPAPTRKPIVWQSVIQNTAFTLPGYEVSWSPVANQLAYSSCPEINYEDYPHYPQANSEGLFVVDAVTKTTTDVTPAGYQCPFITLLSDWRPSGEGFLYYQPHPEIADLPRFSSLWYLNLASQPSSSLDLNINGDWLTAGWGDNQHLVISEYYPLYNRYISVYTFEPQEHTAYTAIHGGLSGDDNWPWLTLHYYDSSQNYDVAGALHAFNDTTNYLEMENLIIPNRKSRFLDWLTGTSQMLVVTTDEPGGFPSSDDFVSIPTALQLWNVETDELQLLIPNGLDGAFSPDRTYLTFVQWQEDKIVWQLLNRVTGEEKAIQTLPIQAGSGQFHFSPSGRYLSYFYYLPDNRQDGTLVIYDLVKQGIEVELPGIPGRYPWNWSWSPTEDKFVYELTITPETSNNFSKSSWAIIDLTEHLFKQLTISGGDELSSPLWSFDSSYLSFRYGAETVVIRP